jgi:catechol 2,3-dioxygenase-like lactoylglutathione lyase family enzyme
LATAETLRGHFQRSGAQRAGFDLLYTRAVLVTNFGRGSGCRTRIEIKAPEPTEVDMSSVQASSESATGARQEATTEMKLEVVVVPVSDVDRAKRFYQGLGWRLDADFVAGDDFRVVQLTPPASAASIIFGTGITSAAPGSIDALQLTVSDIEAARDGLVRHGVDASEVFHDAGGVFHHAGTEARVPGPDPERRSYGSFASFEDPDNNGWVLQEISTRLPGRVAPETTYRSADDLQQALRRAAAAHGEHEARTGQEDPDWPNWYAEYMVRERAGEELPQ